MLLSDEAFVVIAIVVSVPVTTFIVGLFLWLIDRSR